MGSPEESSNKNSDSLKKDDLYQRNRNLRNARINLAIAVITIFLALWAIILAFISQIITPEIAINVCDGTFNISNNCSCDGGKGMQYNINQSNVSYFSLAQFLTHSNVFNVLIFFGIIVTIILFFIWRMFARHLCMKQIKNFKKISPNSDKSDDELISNTVKNWDWYTFILVLLLWLVGLIELVKILKINPIPIPQFLNTFVSWALLDARIQDNVCKFTLDLGSEIVWWIVGWLVLWLIWRFVFKISLWKKLKSVWNRLKMFYNKYDYCK
jgi:magnesium-transporting ATPase (P-type)